LTVTGGFAHNGAAVQIALDAPIPDWESFEFALECADPLIQFYYDIVTGEVHVTGSFEDDPGERERIDADPLRYREIGHLRPGEAHGWMERFAAEEVSDEQLRGRLRRAIVGRGCFRRFKEALLAAPAERARWFDYRNSLLRRSIERWFVESGLSVGARPPWWTAESPQGDSAR